MCNSRFSGEGTLDSIEILFEYHFCYCEIPEFTLTCVSEGGPATTVIWWRDGEPVQEDSNHTTSQIIVDTSKNTIYNNTLRIRGREGGQYKCSVSNNLSDYAPWRARLSRRTTSLTVEGM